jgi:hypothetical protein
MPRTYVQKKPQVDRQLVECCVKRVKEGVSIREACRDLNLSLTTVRRHMKAELHGVSLPPPGGIPSLPPHIEAEIACVAKTAAVNGFGLQKFELKKYIGDYVTANWNCETVLGKYLRAHCQFVSHVPSNDWVTSFLHRHHLSLVVAAPMERSRKEAEMDPFLVYEYFNLFQREVDRLELTNSPAHIYNVDETAFFDDPSRGKVVTEKGIPTHRPISGCGRDCFTAMAAVSADGKNLPPLVIFKAKNFYTTWKGNAALPGTTYAISENGWITSEIWIEWFHTFLREVRERPLILIMDGHRTHLTLQFIQIARENNVTAIKLPAHMTHRLQPLDLCCFKSLKMAWDKELVSFQRHHGFSHLKK